MFCNDEMLAISLGVESIDRICYEAVECRSCLVGIKKTNGAFVIE